MSNNKQSSVEMIEEFLLSHCNPTICNVEWSDFKLMLEQAKEMHKEEKIKFATDFFFWWYNQTSGTNTVEAVEKYYNETFGGNNEDTNRPLG